MKSEKNIYFNVLSFVKKHVKDYQIVSNGKEIVVNCSWCAPKDYKKKLTINAISGLWHCWKCGKKGNFNSFCRQYAKERIDPSFFITEKKKILVPSTQYPSNTVNEIPYPENFSFLSSVKNFEKSLSTKKYFDYLINRGLSIEDIFYYRIGYCSHGKYANRVIIPVYRDDIFVSFIARAITEDIKPKVLTPASLPGTHGIKDYVFNLDRAKDTKLLLIGEGVFDAIALGVSGICLFGKEATKYQLSQIIQAKPRRTVICLDGDAYDYSVKLGKQLLLHLEDIRICKFPQEQDPSSLGSAVKEYIFNSEPFTG